MPGEKKEGAAAKVASDGVRSTEFAQVIAVAPADTVEAQPITGSFLAMDSRSITVRQERCAKVRNRNVSCLRCAEACTSGCISVVDNELRVDVRKCVGCGTCATVCPTCALESHNPNDVQLAHQAQLATSEGRTVVGCHVALEAVAGLVDTKRVAEVVCAGRVEESLLARLAADGVREVDIVCGNCAMCAQRHGRATANMVVESAKALLSAWGNDMAIRVADEFPDSVLAEGVSCDEAREALREYFTQIRSNKVIDAGQEAHPEGQDDVEDDTWEATAAALLPKDFDEAWTGSRRREAAPKNRVLRVMADGTLPHFLPDRRERLLDALFELGEPQTDKISSRLWGYIVINGALCTSCRMCSTFCPTGAITRFDEEDGTFGVKHYPGDCVKCKSCVDICPAHAILMFDDVKPSYLMEGETHRYIMRPREATVGDAHQILSHMQSLLKGSHIFER